MAPFPPLACVWTEGGNPCCFLLLGLNIRCCLGVPWQGKLVPALEATPTSQLSFKEPSFCTTVKVTCHLGCLFAASYSHSETYELPLCPSKLLQTKPYTICLSIKRISFLCGEMKSDLQCKNECSLSWEVVACRWSVSFFTDLVGAVPGEVKCPSY